MALPRVQNPLTKQTFYTTTEPTEAEPTFGHYVKPRSSHQRATAHVICSRFVGAAQLGFPFPLLFYFGEPKGILNNLPVI